MSLGDKLKSLSYLMRKQPYEIERPIVIQFPVIDICNSRCQMCRIWENKRSEDITPTRLRSGLRNPLYSEVTGVGLNGGEPTLRKDLVDLTNVLYEELPKLQSISLITNAFQYKEVIQRISEVGRAIKSHGGKLDVMVSLDGYGEVHERVRGKPGNFARAEKVIDFITQSDLVDSVRIGCTIIRENVFELHDLLDWCQSKGLYIKYRLGVPHQRLYTADLRTPYALTFEERYHVAEFLEGLIAHYETNEAQKHFYRSLIGQLVLEKPRMAGCDWQHRGATITAAGELLYCAVQSKPLGMIDQVDSEEAFFSNAPHLADIRAQHCADCHHDYVGLPSRSEQIRQLRMRLLDRARMAPHFRRVAALGPVSAWRGKRRLEQRRAQLRPLVEQAPRYARKPDRIGRRRVLICGWYGTETLGDKAILGGLVKVLTEELGSLDLTIVALSEYVTKITRQQMRELSDARIISPEDAITIVHDQDLVVFGGGPIMAIRELADMEAIFAAARNAGVSTLIGGCGVGPIGDAAHQRQIARLLNLADARVYRDQKSYDAAAKLGVDVQHDLVAEDPAFSWLTTLDRPDSKPDRGTKKTLLLGLRDFPWREYATHFSAAEGARVALAYERSVVDALERLIACRPDLTIRPLPMCTNHFGGDDRFFYRRLLSQSSDELRSRTDLSLLGRELPPTDYVHAFWQADAMICMRFHSLVFAIATGLPAVVLDYTLNRGKVAALADRFNLPVRPLDDLDSNFIVDAVLQQLDAPNIPTLVPQLDGALTTLLGRLGLAGKKGRPDRSVLVA